jgi:tRNA A37 threonylcarbamoyladenosine synthetase subunit TsaC/SUA5/YrdC
MVKINSTSRLLSINTKIILTQTDTTVGFVSQNQTRLQSIKERPTSKPFIKVYKDFKSFTKDNKRIPNSQKNRIRRSKKTTYIVNELAFRVAEDKLYSSILRKVRWNYSTSANETTKSFNRDFCEEKTDIIIEDKSSLYEGTSSSLYKINNKIIKRLR